MKSPLKLAPRSTINGGSRIVDLALRARQRERAPSPALSTSAGIHLCEQPGLALVRESEALAADADD